MRIGYRCSPEHQEIRDELAKIRDELDIADEFPPEVLTEADERVIVGPELPPGTPSAPIPDRTDLELVTIDPPESMDLDQAFAAERTASGWRVFYAIADVAAWVPPSGAIDTEARHRGFTMYSPDGRAPLHPAQISEGAASLLPNLDRQSLLWTIDLDDAGTLLDAHLGRALVRSRAKLSYADAEAGIDAGDQPVLSALREIGLRREALEVERGAVSLKLAQQEVVANGDGFELEYDISRPVEGWNAQISLLTGIAGAKIMLEGGIGILRTLPPADGRTVKELRQTAKALGVDWPKDRSYADVVRGLDPNDPQQAALIAQSARGLRGAGYVAFDGELPGATRHSAIAAEYAHVTAPLRRLGDRFANECILAHVDGRDPADWVREALPELPKLLGRARNREGSLDRAAIDLIEAAILREHVGQTFQGIITNEDDDGRTRIQLRDPAVVAYSRGGELGDEVTVRLTSADLSARMVTFDLVNQ
ncbi:MAG: RNB domain-containing ribonuclease [Acidimicrobiales bacterium]